MNLISFLSMKIEKFAFGINEIIIYFVPFLEPYLNNHPETIMIVIGFGGQALFATRFIIQWLSSENAGRSVIPVAFWYFSITGGLVLLTYAIWRQDPVIIAGQSVGVFIYARNLYFISKEKKQNKD
ncbi:lipid-A-disaccharide synthase N-terminal domain-containing protein [Alphaproteobacteria bacterium]|nr:lipid-A-disaccharide synthase N-terminal domain-containing protein [Alphaproteobacteria bacterium]|tara:strand:- start:45 stop:422 length:378 start_codon:yes stop_codon:yes gene_type:complete